MPASGGAQFRTGHSARTSAQRVLKWSAGVFDRIRPLQRGVVVLAYHRVGERSAAVEIELPTSRFDAQLQVLAERGVTCTIDQALTALESPAPEGRDPVVVTFDDGTDDFTDIVVPLLVQHNIPAVIYVATDFVERGRTFPGSGRPLSWSALRDAYATGLVTVGSHSHSHVLFDRIDERSAAAELDRSIDLIGERLGVAPRHFAYPKALRGNARVGAIVRDRFGSAAVAGTRANRYQRTDVYALARSPVQRGDGMEWFEAKLAGGLRLEDDVRRLANRVRYAGATT